MKILFLNLNCGRNDFKEVLNYVKENKDIDVFCFQEIKNEIFEEISIILKDYNLKFFSKELENFGSFNLATFIHKKNENYNFEILENNYEITAPAIYLELESGNSKWNILNFHGNPYPGTKLDTSERINATKRIISFMNKKEGSKIIGGDFNLFPDTKSITAFENFGYKNLIKEFDIKTTRNNNSWKLYPEKQLFADYVFISKEIKVKNFTVIENEISDHLPMILEI